MRTLVSQGALAYVVIAAIACSKSPSSPPEPTAAPVPSTPSPPSSKPVTNPTPDASAPSTEPQLEWSLARDGAKLKVSYRLTNRSAGPLYVVDKLVVPAPGNKFQRTEHITVMNDDAPNTVKLALAAISSDRPSVVVYTPTFRRVDPGQVTDATIEVPWPLTAWNPVGGANPISPSATSAVFLLMYFEGEPPRWKTLASDDMDLKVPEGHSPRVVRGAPQPLPR